jgi:hypothetical protein
MTQKVVRAADLKPPLPISDDDFDALCTVHKIKPSDRAVARDFLREVVAAFAEAIQRERTLPTRKADRLAIERASADLRRAQRRLQRRTGPAGRVGSRVAGRGIASAISVSWMRRHFADDPAIPNAIYWSADDRSGRTPARVPARPIDTDDLSLDQRIGFMERRGADAIAALIGDIAGALEGAQRAIVHLPNGRKPLKHRAYLLAALAELWHRLGHRPTGGVNSQYGSFAETVLATIDWPTDGVNAAVPNAIKLWRHLYRR